MTTTLGYYFRGRAEKATAPEEQVTLRAAAAVAHLYDRNVSIRAWIDMLIEQED